MGNRSFSRRGDSRNGGERAEALVGGLVEGGIKKDFKRVVFPKYAAMREVKRVLERSRAKYVSLSGSGSTVYGLFADKQTAATAARSLMNIGVRAKATVTLPREQYWKTMFG